MCLVVKFKGKPDAGNPPVRFDEGEGAAFLPTLLANKNQSVFLSDLLDLRGLISFDPHP